jgi:hypothetical protein
MVTCTCYPSYTRGIKKRIIVQADLGKKIEDPTWKITKAKRARYVPHIVEHLPSRQQILRSNCRTTTNDSINNNHHYFKQH